MKKLTLIFFAVITFSICLFTLSASADRMTSSPVTLCESDNSGGSLFTITKVSMYTPYLLSGEDTFKKSLSFDVHGYFDNYVSANGSMDFTLYCYDTAGNHIDTQYFSISSTGYSSVVYEYGSYHYFKVPDVTASIEIAARYPGSWSNTLYINNYRNVWSSDGRALGIPTLMLPVYQSVGWYGDITMWSLDGRTIDVPYPDVSKYKKVGWYEYEDYLIKKFRQNYKTNLIYGNYNQIIVDADSALIPLGGTYYAKELYTAKTYAMDALRKKVNAPIAVTSYYVTQGSNYSQIAIDLRNVSYKTIKAFKFKFTCYNVFGEIEEREQIYYADDTLLTSCKSNTYWWKKFNTDIEYISAPILTQVTYSDNTFWTR